MSVRQGGLQHLLALSQPCGKYAQCAASSRSRGTDRPFAESSWQAPIALIPSELCGFEQWVRSTLSAT
jgi:hypothetical protein